ncbi:MAG: ANTAR domain-containing protein [Candidatus Roizmanbacteria bacterium]
MKTITWVEIVTLLADLVVFESLQFNEFLKKLIKLLSQLIPADSYLIYLYDREKNQLILVGSKKSKAKLVGKLTMKSGEGITGWVVEHKKPVILEKEAYKDERFLFFKELPEDRYEAFLSVPIIDKKGVVGVINIQNKTPRKFSKEETKIVGGIVKIISSAFEQIALGRQVDFLKDKLEERKIVEKAKGLLMKLKGYSENEAYRVLQTEAMKKRKSIKEIADAIILVY